MAIANYTTYANALSGKQRQRITVGKTAALSSINGVALENERFYSSWLWKNNAGALPTTAAACSSATQGSFPFQDSSGVQRLIGAMVSTSSMPTAFQMYNASSTPGAQPPGTVEGYLNASSQSPVFSAVVAPTGMVVIYDRLSHQSISSVSFSAGANTTNLPTAALTRYTSGVGVEAALEMYGYLNFGNSNNDASDAVNLSYTNQSGTTGRTGSKVHPAKMDVTGATQYNPDGQWRESRVIPMPLTGGDRGVQAVASVTFAGPSGDFGTGVWAGGSGGGGTNTGFGVTLYYPICVIPITHSQHSGMSGGNFEALFSGGCWFPTIPNGACLSAFVRMNTFGPNRQVANNGSGNPDNMSGRDFPQQFLIDLTVSED